MWGKLGWSWKKERLCESSEECVGEEESEDDCWPCFRCLETVHIEGFREERIWERRVGCWDCEDERMGRQAMWRVVELGEGTGES